MFTAKNPAYGALLSYYLKEAIPPEAPKRNSDEKTDAAEQRPRREARTEAAAEKKEGKLQLMPEKLRTLGTPFDTNS